MCQRRRLRLDGVMLATVEAGGMGYGIQVAKICLGSVLWSPGLSARFIGRDAHIREWMVGVYCIFVYVIYISLHVNMFGRLVIFVALRCYNTCHKSRPIQKQIR